MVQYPELVTGGAVTPLGWKGHGEWLPEPRDRDTVSRGLYSSHKGPCQPVGPHIQEAGKNDLILCLPSHLLLGLYQLDTTREGAH